MRRRRAAAWTGGAALLAGGVWLFSLRSPPPPSPPPSGTAAGAHPHLLIEEIDTLATGAGGRALHRLRAEELRRAAPGEPSGLTAPRLTVFSGTGTDWHFTAPHGEVSPDGGTIRLPGRVRGWRTGGPRLELRTHDVVILTSERYGETARPAVLLGEGFRAEGTGMKVWPDEDRVELLTRARGTFRSG